MVAFIVDHWHYIPYVVVAVCMVATFWFLRDEV